MSSIIESKISEDTEYRKIERRNGNLVKILLTVVMIEIVALFVIYSYKNIEGSHFGSMSGFICFVAALAIVLFFIDFLVENKFGIAAEEKALEQVIKKMSAENNNREKGNYNNKNKVFAPKVNYYQSEQKTDALLLLTATKHPLE